MPTRRPPGLTVRVLLQLSIGCAVLTIALKTAAWWLTDSVGLLSDAMESLVNLASAAFALTMVSIADRPPDDDHPFGHTKAEYFSSGFEGLLIVLAALGICWAAWHRLRVPQPLESLGLGIGLTVLGSLLNGMLAWRMLLTSRAQRSIALDADARHLLTDVWTSAGVVTGLVLVALTGWQWLDPLLAVAVALNILREGVRLVWRSVDGLMDRAVDDDLRALIDDQLAGFADPAVRFDHVVTRRAGRRVFIDLHLHVPASWTLGRAAALRAAVEERLLQHVPGLWATIQLLPTDVEPHAGNGEAPS